MLHWYYMWSPKYEVFHRILEKTLKDISGIEVHPLFFEQSCFNRLAENETGHFFKGLTIKERTLYEALEKHKGEYIIYSDVDIIVRDNNLIDYLEMYKDNDMTYLHEIQNDKNGTCNLGFSMIKSTEKTIQFHKDVCETIMNEGGWDQHIVNLKLKTYDGV